MPLNGKDLSQYQGRTIDMSALRDAGTDYVIVKATEGSGYTDPCFARNRDHARTSGILRGWYHFSRLQGQSQVEADCFLDAIGPLQPGEILVLDYEVPGPPERVQWCLNFCARCAERTGVVPLIYMNLSTVRGSDWGPVARAGVKLWLAYYDGKPDPVSASPFDVVMKQYSETGRTASLDSDVDLDRFYGDENDFRAMGYQMKGRLKMPIHTYGLIPDRHDPRDCAAPMRITGALPPIVDLRDNCPPIFDQGQLGSCTANAIVGLREYWEVAQGKPLTDLSRLMLYYQERALEGSVQEDSGAQIRDGMKALAKVGVCPESDWPYDIATFADKPSDWAQCLIDAVHYRVTTYHRVANLADLRQQLAGGFPVVLGIQVYAGMEGEQTTRTGIVKVPKRGEKLLGGHAILAVGYNDKTRYVTIRNSWGTTWGAAGYGFLPYTYFAKTGLVSDMWTGE